jgi:hypothetical protein
MKQHLNKLWVGVVLLAFASLFFASSFDRTSTANLEVTDENGNTAEMYLAPKSYQKVFARDSMSTAGNSTVAIPWIMASPYQYQYYIRLKKIGVTPNIKMVLQEANSTASDLWSPIDSVSCSGADSTKLHFRLRGTTTYGARHRILFVKTGTTLVQRDIILNIKPPNQ